jgi:hypothetical protein
MEPPSVADRLRRRVGIPGFEERVIFPVSRKSIATARLLRYVVNTMLLFLNADDSESGCCASAVDLGSRRVTSRDRQRARG